MSSAQLLESMKKNQFGANMLKHMYGGTGKQHTTALQRKSAPSLPPDAPHVTDAVVAIEQCADPDPAQLGGKGLRLAELANRFPVPDAIVVPTTTCFEHHQRAGILDRLSERLRSGGSVIEQARQDTLKLTLEPELVEAIEGFIARVQRRLGRKCAFAVRSSASMEFMTVVS